MIAEGDFVADDETVVGELPWTNWGDNQPSNVWTNDGVIISGSNNGKWYDIDTDQQAYTICVFKA